MKAPSVRTDLERDLECLDLLGCLHGLNERDQMAVQQLRQAETELTVDDVADRLDCERSTAYRSVSRLLDAGVVVHEQVNYDHGGYYYVFRPRPPAEAEHDMQRLLNDWYAVVEQRIEAFAETFDQDSDDRGDQPLPSRP
jgi:predicted transcriptional regulator